MARQFLMGNEAFAHAALAAGCGMFAGYPGTPSSEVIETVARLRADGVAQDIHVEWSTNEKAALEVAAAASLSGMRALVTCKQVGLNVASDALMSLNYVGVKGGLVILVADDPGPISSQTEQDTRRFAAFAKVPVFDPATPEQGADMIAHAFRLSERYQTPVIFRPTTRIDHASAAFDFPETTTAKPLIGDGFHRNPQDYVIFPPRAYQAHGEINERLHAIAHDFMFDPELTAFNPLFTNMLPNGENAPGMGKRASLRLEPDRDDAPIPANVGIVVGGVSTQYAREALRLLDRLAARAGRRLPALRLLQIGTPYPFPRRVASRALKDLTDVLVLEELDSVIEEELQKMANVSFLWPRIHGKLSDEARARGENSTEDALVRIAAFLDAYAGEEGVARDPAVGSFTGIVQASLGPDALYEFPGTLPARPAVLCAGCPHRASFLAIKRALAQLGVKREDAVFTGDIGCYTLGNAMPLDAVDTCLCMGGGITMAQGIAVANPPKKAIAFVGDSTFFASGMTGIVNATYNNHDVTVCVLDNATTAMTGLQPHPGTGLTLMGDKRDPVSIRAILKAANVEKIVEVDPLDPSAAEEAAVEALAYEGPSAILFKSPCVWTAPFGIPAKVNASKCTGCKKCVKEIGCPAIGFSVEARGVKSGKRGQALIDRTQCNGCGLCLPVCPVDAIDQTPEVEPQPVRQSRLNRDASPAQKPEVGSGDASERKGAADIGEPVELQVEEQERDPEAPLRRTADASALSRAYADERASDHQGVGGLASERLSGIRNQAPIIPMNPYGSLDDFEDDDLYEDMTTRARAASEALGPHRAKRVIKPEGQRHYFMKEPQQRNAAALVFAYTPSGELSQKTQLSLGKASSEERPKRSQPDYGGNSELSLESLFSGEATADVEMDDAGGLEPHGVSEPLTAQGSVDSNEGEESLGELALSFDGLHLELGEEPDGRRSSGHGTERALRRVERRTEGRPDESPRDEDAVREESRVDGPQGSLIPQNRPTRSAAGKQQPPFQTPVQSSGSRSLRSRFADYGQHPGASASGSESSGAHNPWRGGRP